MVEKSKYVSSESGGMFMSEKYLIVSQAEQVPPYDPKAMAEGLGMTLLGFLGPLLLELDQWLDKRLIRTLVQAMEAILTFRDRINGLVLSETFQLSRSLGPGRGHQATEPEARTARSGRPCSSNASCGGEPASRWSSGKARARRGW